MQTKLLTLVLGLLLVLPGSAFARGHGNGGGHRRGGYHSSRTYSGGRHSSVVHVGGGRHGGGGRLKLTTGGGRAHRSPSQFRASGVARDSHGRIKRSQSAKNEFKHSHPCPSNGKTGGACPGYVIDHVQALKHGGADAPSNMQWQTKAAAKAKDKWE